MFIMNENGFYRKYVRDIAVFYVLCPKKFLGFRRKVPTFLPKSL